MGGWKGSDALFIRTGRRTAGHHCVHVSAQYKTRIAYNDYSTVQYIDTVQCCTHNKIDSHLFVGDVFLVSHNNPSYHEICSCVNSNIRVYAIL